MSKTTTWIVDEFEIRLRTKGKRAMVTGLVAMGRNVGIHTDPSSRELNVTILSGPNAGLRRGPSFADLGKAAAFALAISIDSP